MKTIQRRLAVPDEAQPGRSASALAGGRQAGRSRSKSFSRAKKGTTPGVGTYLVSWFILWVSSSGLRDTWRAGRTLFWVCLEGISVPKAE